MKKESQFFMIGLTILFVGFLLGILFGRSVSREPVIIQSVLTETTLPAESTVPMESSSSGISHNGKININTASAELLDTLPGVGPVLAQRIIEHRETVGPFHQVSDLSNVNGIGPATMLKLLDFITVED